MIIFDSNVWIAGYNEADSLHQKAQELYFSLEHETITVPEYVWIEVSTVLEQKSTPHAGKDFLDIIEFGDGVEMLYFSKEEVKQFMQFYRSDTTKGLSFIDSTLLFLSKQYKIYTFDKRLQSAIESFGGK